MNSNHNGTVKWLIALGVTSALAMGGWAYAATQSARLGMVNEVKSDVKYLQELGVQNDRRIYVLEEQFRTIFMSLEEIKGLIRQHEEKSKWSKEPDTGTTVAVISSRPTIRPRNCCESA